MLTSNGGEVTGIDLSPTAIELNRTTAGRRAEFCIMNAEYLAFADNSFDLICGMGILHHLDLERSFSELSRVLKPNGTAVFLEPLGHNPVINLYRRLTPKMRTPDEHPLLVSDFEIATSRFSSIDLNYFHLTSLAAVMLRGTALFLPMAKWLDRVDQHLFRYSSIARKNAWAVAIVLSHPAKQRQNRCEALA
jgi:SAM-dependent methyltransferase